jgi:hypothetical protein
MRYLLRVQDAFLVSGTGLVLAPDIPFPAHFKNFTDTVLVEPPAGESFQTVANFFLTHFRPGGFKLLVTLPNALAALVPIGSRISAPESVHTRLVGADA